MAYKIKAKHNIPKKSIPLNLRYNDAEANLPDIPIMLSDTEKIFTLTGWENVPGGIDVEKISIVERTYEDSENIYNINSVNIGLDGGQNTATMEAQIEYENYENDAQDVTDDKHDDIIAAYLSKQYTLAASMILSDNAKKRYDVRKSIKDTMSDIYDDAEFASEYGGDKECAIVVERCGDRVPYCSIYFRNTLLEANSQYGRILGYEKAAGMGQTINCEGRKNGAACFGPMKNWNILTYSLKVPDLTDTIIEMPELYHGDPANSSVLSICFAPDYTEASTSYRPCSGVVYVDGYKLSNERRAFYRVRIDNGNHVVSANSIKYDGKTNWYTLGNHYITTPLYSDNVLKIVIFNDEAKHGIYQDLYLQAKANKWGLPPSMFRGSAPTPPEEMETDGWPAIPADFSVIETSLYMRYIQNSDGSWDGYAFLNCGRNDVEIPVKFGFGDTSVQYTLHAGVLGKCSNVMKTSPGMVFETPISTGNWTDAIYEGDSQKIAYVIGEVVSSYDPWSGYEHVCLPPSNKSTISFDYRKNDYIVAFGDLDNSISDIDENGTKVLSGGLDTLFQNGEYTETTFPHEYKREKASGFYRIVKFTTTGRHIIGPFKASTDESGYSFNPDPSGGTVIAENKINLIADNAFNNLTSRFSKKTIQYTDGGNTYTGYIFVANDSEGPGEYIITNSNDERVSGS